MRARHIEENANTMDVDKRHLLDLLTWDIGTPCSAHDSHKALCWATERFVEDPKSMSKELWIVVQSLKNSSSVINAEIPTMLDEVVFMDDDIDGDAAEARWKTLGLDPDLVAELVWASPRVKDCKLHLHPRVADDVLWRERATTLLMAVFQWVSFADSRWASRGRTAQRILAGVAVGLEILYNKVFLNPKATKYYLKGIRRLTPALKLWLAIIAMASWPCDAALCSLLDDDRILLRFDQITTDISDEMRFLTLVSEDVWRWLLHLTGDSNLSVAKLRSDCLEPAHVAASFMYDRFLRLPRKNPFALAVGDLNKNMDALARAPPVKDSEVASKIQTLLQLGAHPREKVRRALVLVQSLNWTSVCAEQLHAILTTLQRFHHRYGKETMATRCFLIAISPLVYRFTADLFEQHLRAKIAKLSRKRPENITGKCEFVRTAMLAMNGQLGRKLTNAEKIKSSKATGIGGA